MAEAALTVDVFSDVVCPWCYLGKRRLAQALSMLPDMKVAIRWRPFQLDGTIPPGGIDRRDYMERKFGSLDAIAPTHRHLTEVGAAEGLDYRFDRITRSPNTLDAHRLIRWAGAAGRQEPVVERLFRAYFTDGLDVGDDAVLARLAGEEGLDEATVRARLSSDEDRDAVLEEIEHAHLIGVTGVPCFVIASRYAVVGAQPAETIANAIRTAAEERTGMAAG